MSQISPSTKSELPKEWSSETLLLGKLFTFHAGKAPGARGALILGSIILVLCLYWDWLFFKNWFLDGAEILPGGVILFLVILGGAAFGIYCLRRVFSSTSYLLSSDSLTVSSKQFSKVTIEKYLKGEISGINLLHTPPKEAGQVGSWKVVLDIKSLSGGKNRILALEGNGEVEAEILSTELSQWSGLKVHRENTNV